MRNINFYNDRISEFESVKKQQDKKLRRFTWLRLSFFLGAIISFYLFFPVNVWLSVATAFFFIGFFIWSIIRYNNIQRLKQFTGRLIEISRDELQALNGNISQFHNGSEFMNPEHPFSFDMDLFGPGSLFQFLNRTRSGEGESMLASFLEQTELDQNIVRKNQKIIAELSEKFDFQHRFRASFSLVDAYSSEQKQQLLHWLYQKSSFFKTRNLPILSFILPVLFFTVLLLAVFSVVSYNLLLYAFLINLGVISLRLKDINNIHSILSEHGTKLKEYSGILSLIENEHFESDKALELKSSLHHNNESSSAILKKLGKLVDLFDNRLNLIMNLVLNGLLLWDFHCIRRLEKWKKKYQSSVAHWFTSITNFDAYISLANYAFNYPENTYAVFSEGSTILSAKKIGHPLIDPKELVRNDYTMNEQHFIIVTGANMAGKSTFLRTVGINLILAMTGAPVCAEEFKFKPLKLFTSMRTSDSLQKNESYFYAELKRLKELLEMIKNDGNVMIILDEILKGTNSEDKQKGSKMFLHQLVERKATGIIATHDLTLAAMEEKHKGTIKNYCFEIEIEGENIHFDYKLKPGVTRKMNASILMEQMGLLDYKENMQQ